jgi:Fe-S cluster assembly protein SufD
MTSTLQASDKQGFLDAFSRLESDLLTPQRPALSRLRKATIARFGQLGFPTLRNEDWRFTNISPIVEGGFQPATGSPVAEVVRLQLQAPPLKSHDFSYGLTPPRSPIIGLDAPHRLVFVDGFLAPALSAIPDGMRVLPLSDGLASSADEIEAHLGRIARFEDQALVALNTAFFRDGAWISTARGAVLPEPVYLVFLSTGAAGVANFPRNLIVLGENSQVTLVESYASLAEGASFTCAVTEVLVGERALVDHYKVLEESRSAYHFGCLQVVQQAGSTFSTHFVALGGALVRNEVRVLLDGEGCESTVNGLYQAGGQQHIDNHTVIDHARAHCASHELYKGILDGRAKGVFNGKIFVRQDAQKTDAKQTNQTLLLSDDATINTKPQLEIFADDVKCTHGATVGQLDLDQLFYLRSRGLGLAEARALLTFAFANDIIGRFKIAALQSRLEEELLAARQLPRVERF